MEQVELSKEYAYERVTSTHNVTYATMQCDQRGILLRR